MRQLDSLEKDALGELLNMAMGQAAASLSVIAEREVQMGVPAVELVSRADFLRDLGEDADGIVGITEHFAGSFEGDAKLILFRDKSMNLLQVLLQDEPELATAEFTDLEKEVLTEVGNILLNACIATLANLLDCRFDTGLPVFTRGKPADVLGDAGSSTEMTHLLLAKVAFSVDELDISGNVALMVSMSALDALLAELMGVMQ